jgi:hypothetical protein
VKITVTKIGAARSQLIEAIRLFFEQRDPVSIHTLVGASLQILHDHIDDVSIVWDKNLFLHKDTIFIKDEYRKEWHAKVNEARNFFKHADRDLRDGKTIIEFEASLHHVLPRVFLSRPIAITLCVTGQSRDTNSIVPALESVR